MLFCLFSDAVMRTDIYSKTPSTISASLPYFPTMNDQSYLPSPHVTSLQHQLHVVTSSSQVEINNSQNWSNLVIPYQPPCYKSIPQDHQLDKKDQALTETKNCKKKNPYSIEELLKKPNKVQPLRFACMGIRQPYGGLVINEEFEKESSCQSSSDSEQEKDVKIDVELE